MNVIKKSIIYIIIILMPVIAISILIGKNFNIANFIYGIEDLSIFEDFLDLKELMKFDSYNIDWNISFSFEGIEQLVSNIFKIMEIFFNIIKEIFSIIVIDPIKAIIEIFNLIFV